jgi:hypothetical protein
MLGRRVIVLGLVGALGLQGVKIGVTQIAAGSTLAVNLLEIKTTVAKTRNAIHVAKTKIKKVVKK